MSKKKSEPITGAVHVMAMPFDSDGIIDEDSLRHQIDFCIEAGAKGIAFLEGKGELGIRFNEDINQSLNSSDYHVSVNGKDYGITIHSK